MKKLEKYLNVLHFCIYRFDYKLHLFSNKINPFHLIHKLPFLQKRYNELGVEPIKMINKLFFDKSYGFSIMVAGGALLGILFFFFVAVLNIQLKILLGDITLNAAHFIFCVVLSVVSSYFFVFKKDKYLIYFKQFEGWGKLDKIKYGWFTFTFVLLVFCLFVLSLKI